MKNMPNKPGRYVEYEGRDGTLKYAPLTQAMHDRRCAIAKALGYVLPEKCTLCNVYGDNGHRHDCWENPDEYQLKGGKASSFHHVFSTDLSRYGAPKGAVGFCWMDEVEAAAYAIDKRKPLPDDPKDAGELTETQAQSQLFT